MPDIQKETFQKKHFIGVAQGESGATLFFMEETASVKTAHIAAFLTGIINPPGVGAFGYTRGIVRMGCIFV